jgi:transcription elongation factor Elf1
MPKCPNCGNEKLKKAGFSTTRNGKKQILQCKECGRYFYDSPQVLKDVNTQTAYTTKGSSTLEEKTFNNPAVKERKERIEELFNDIKNNPDTPLDRIMGKYSLRTGLSNRKINEYLRLLEMEGRIVIDWQNNSAKLP